MRIKQLFLKTAKQDQTKLNNHLENTMERAGFIRKHENIFFYTPTGLLLRNTLEKNIIDILENEGFMEGHIPKSSTVSSMVLNIGMVNDALATSYKDLPMKFYYQEMLDFNKEGHKSLWQTKTQKVLSFSMADLPENKMEDPIEKILSSLFKNIPNYEGAYFYPMMEAKESYKKPGLDKAGEMDVLKYNKVQQTKVETPAKKTVKEVCEYLSITEEDLLKTMIYSHGQNDYGVIVLGTKEVDVLKLTRVLGLEMGSLVQKEECRVKEDLSVSPGYLGPVGLKVSRILIDRQVIKEKPYVAGANEDNYHLTGIVYGRDYKGDFYDLVKDCKEEKGWVLGECREGLPMLRVQNALSGLDYIPLEAGYINIDRLLLAICHQSLTREGFKLPSNIGWFDAVVTVVDARDKDALEATYEIEQSILNAGLKVLLDDRKDRLGSKFRDYDLISIPYRIIVGRNFKEGFDFKDSSGKSISVNFQNVVAMLENAVLKSKKELLKDTEEKNETL